MQINVSQLLKASVGSMRKYKVSEVSCIAGIDRMIRGDIILIRTNRGLLAKGALYTKVEATCSRCLRLFEYPLTLDIEEEYFPSTDVVSGATLALPEEPSSFSIDDNHVLDFTEAIRQYTLMALPMRSICRENCAGLCPNCGYDLNQGSCGCSYQRVNPCWAELKKLTSSGKTSVNGQ